MPRDGDGAPEGGAGAVGQASVTGEPTRDGLLRDDPRVRTDHVRVRHVGADDNRVLLVGVVHDHPASCYRAGAVVEDAVPDVVALELPGLAIPLFEQFAAGPEDADDPGGEMSAAIRAAGEAEVRGIDVPSPAFVRALAGTLRDVSPSRGDLLDVAAQTAAVTRHAVRCRLAALPAPLGGGDPPVDALEYDCDPADPPAEQADHEATRLRQSRSLLGAVDHPVAARVTDATRERAMARRLAALGRTGDVVAIVGFDHLDDVAAALAESGYGTRGSP